ncbi:MAG TPA: dihydroorotate dehydrogenase catalytic subunit [Gaiellaceae bacterium]
MILNGSGCLDALTAPETAHQLDAFVTKTVTPLPREGNEPVRIAEVEGGMLNSIGLANPGIDAFCADVLPRLQELGVPLWVSVGGFCTEDYAAVCARLDGTAVDVLELNVSCPNVKAPDAAVAEIVAAAREATSKPLYAKLSPALPDLAQAATAAADAGASGLTLVNTLRGLALDERTLAPVLGTAAGGLSGPALRSVALAAVHSCFGATELPIVGLGGVATGRHALELIAVGASAVAVGTTLFRDPDAPRRIRAELAAELAALGLSDAAQARGLAHAGGARVLPELAKIPAK